MPMRWYVTTLLVFVTSIATTLRSQPSPKLAVITFDGLDPVRYGMTPSEAATALGVPLNTARGTEAKDACYLLAPDGEPALLFMVERGRIVRIETESEELSTARGARVGDTEGFVRGRYDGDVVVESHPYDPSGHYLVVNSADGKRALVFETDGERVTQVRGGLLPAVRYIEHCL